MRTISYEFYEPNATTFTSASAFHINDSSSELSLLFRLISGTCLISNRNLELAVELNKNYFYSDFRNNDDNDLSFLDNFDESLKLDDYEQFINKNRHKNRKFYKPLLNEIAGCIYYEELERHTSAFVHLYRAYEHMSYAFPMIYASKTDDYIGTFENLRKWLTNSESDGNVGELRFHKSFITTLFKGSPELSSTIDIHITAKDEFKENIFNGLTQKVLCWNNSTQFTTSTVSPDKISVSFVEFHSFIVNLRNRYFHYSNARRDNIGLDDIIESDLLFSMVNKASINFIATIFHGVIRQHM
ncbi:MAG: hypothetical protein PHP95_04195 [Desulfuromonadaceae bacterium]|nr:hypothetical protein [Desulfuromonadaceae bacterium]MDD2847637.1 hypothetical protein [Desulfuromonadaceae bacterium]MDD4131117.1 hypothetical protein [Desulfuromonadaceae bacterium]